MGYGLGVFLLAVGLILAFAVTDRLADVDLTLVGYIVAGAGLLIIVLTAATAASRRRSTSVTQYSDGRRVVNERSDPPPPTV
jgi:membrane protein implicated in regulation of membrane protease activity